MGNMTPGGWIQLTLVMLITLLGCQRGRGQPMTYPPTPLPSPKPSSSANPLVQPPNPDDRTSNLRAPTTVPTDLGPNPTLPITPSRMTVPRTDQMMMMSPSQASAAVDPPRTSLVPLIMGKTTGFPLDVTAPTSTPQRVQMGFNNNYSELGVNEYDVFGNKLIAQAQLVQVCGVTADRITDVNIMPNATGYLVLRFSITQGYPIYTSEAVQLMLNKTQNNPTFMRMGGQTLVLSTTTLWTDDGPCPVNRCMNLGLCNVTLSGSFECQCKPGHAGSECQDVVKPADMSLLALLVLLIIPIGAALIVGFVFGLRRQQKQRLKRAFDLRDVRTIGPKSMLSLPHEPGMRNEMYDTRSFALAFTDTSFSKNSPPPSFSEDDLLSRMGSS